MGHFGKLLVAVDFSDGSERALERAVEMAKQSGAELHVVSVHDVPLHVSHMGAGVEAGLPGGIFDALERLRGELQGKLDALAAQHAGDGPTLVTHLAEGAAADAVVALGEEIGADIIIVGTHGRTGLPHLLLGSVAERIVRMAGRPVLTVPLPKE